MEVARGRADGQPSQLRSGTFTGTVYIDPVLSAPGVSVGNVFFAPGGRTYWHSHSAGQVLTVARGRGLVSTRDGDSRFIGPADVVHAPAGEEHWHGGSEHTYVLHTAMSLGETVWGEEVTDDDYQAAHRRAAGGAA
jgi:quercetin dioxygenase-like cupin family protein